MFNYSLPTTSTPLRSTYVSLMIIRANKTAFLIGTCLVLRRVDKWSAVSKDCCYLHVLVSGLAAPYWSCRFCSRLREDPCLRMCRMLSACALITVREHPKGKEWYRVTLSLRNSTPRACGPRRSLPILKQVAALCILYMGGVFVY